VASTLAVRSLARYPDSLAGFVCLEIVWTEIGGRALTRPGNSVKNPTDYRTVSPDQSW
jgi:hypothetical protein